MGNGANGAILHNALKPAAEEQRHDLDIAITHHPKTEENCAMEIRFNKRNAQSERAVSSQ